jgi:photosystem II stability/assembly factor-like uncharacterized protein
MLLALLCAVLTYSPTGARAADAANENAELAEHADRSLLLDVVPTRGGLIAVGDRGHVLRSTDASTWSQVPAPTRSMLTAVAAVGDAVWAVGHDAVILHSAADGRTWATQHFAPERQAPLLDVWFGNERQGIAIGAYGLALATADGGAHWNEIEVDPDEERHLNAITVAPDGSLYVAAENGTVFRSGDRGQSWQVLPTPYPGSLFGIVALPDGAILAFGLRGHVLRSEDRGRTWTIVPTGTDAGLLGGTALSDGSVLIVGLSGTVLVGSQGGRRFTPHHRADRHGLAAALPLTGDRILLVGEAGTVLIPRLTLTGGPS